MKSVSVVIPTYNKNADVVKAVESILGQEYPVREVLVVDNASSDGTSDEIRKVFGNNKKVHLFNNKENLGVVGGRNKGLSHATGDYILFFDHDMVAKRNMLTELMKIAESDEIIGIVTPKIYYWDKKNVIWAAGTDIDLMTGRTLFHGGLDTGQYDEIREVAVAPAVLLVKRKVIEAIKQFDPVFFATYEDTDFCFRAKEKGFLTFYAPDAIAYHKIPYNLDTSSTRLLTRSYWVSRNRIIFMRRYSKNYVLFLLLQPVFYLYYSFLALRYKKPAALWDYSRGIVDGITAK